MDPPHWRSPGFRGRSPYPRHSNPRFRGGGGGDGGGGFGTPRHFAPRQQWQQRSPSPYRYQSQQGFSPHYHHQQSPHSFATSTPVHGSGGGRRPFFRGGGGGGGRFNKRQSFGGSPSFGKGGSGGSEDIESWVSPEMWADPWRFLLPTQESTKFAESDFNITSASEVDQSSLVTATSSAAEDTNTKFADTNFITDNSDLMVDTSQKLKDENTSSSLSAIPSENVDENSKVKLVSEVVNAEDQDDFEKCATDRVAYDTSDNPQQSPSHS